MWGRLRLPWVSSTSRPDALPKRFPLSLLAGGGGFARRRYGFDPVVRPCWWRPVGRKPLTRSLLALLDDPQEEILERDRGVIDPMHLAAVASDQLFDLLHHAFAQRRREQLRFVLLCKQLVNLAQQLQLARVEDGD